MSFRDLPIQPSVRHLKQEAKQFHKELQDGDPVAIERIRQGLPRLKADASVDDVTLMEAQHVLAREYGFREWPALVAAAELEFETLSVFSDEDTERFLRRVDQKDLVISLKLASDAVKDRMLTVMSERVRTFITEEIEFLGPMPVTEIQDVQSRLLDQARRLGRDEVIGWPPGSDTPPPKPPVEPALDARISDHIEQPLSDLSLDAIRVLVHGLSCHVRDHGVMSLESAARLATDGFVQEALRLAVDGTEPALLEDLLRTRIRALLQHLDNRQRVIHEGVVAICGGDNPRIVAHKLFAVYRVDYGVDVESPGGTLEALQACVRKTPVSEMDLDSLTGLLTGISEFTRRQGLAMLTPLVGDIDDELLREGVRMLADVIDMKTICETQEPRMSRRMAETGARLASFTTGLTAVASAQKGADLDAAISAGTAEYLA